MIPLAIYTRVSDGHMATLVDALGFHCRTSYYCSIVTVITVVKTTRLSVTEVGVAGWAWSTHVAVSASLLPALQMRVFTLHMHMCP